MLSVQYVFFFFFFVASEVNAKPKWAKMCANTLKGTAKKCCSSSSPVVVGGKLKRRDEPEDGRGRRGGELGEKPGTAHGGWAEQ